MTGQRPDPKDFSKDERPREYRVTITVEARLTTTLHADSEDDANRQAPDLAKKFEYDPLEFEADEIDVLSVGPAIKFGPLYRVTRDGTKCQVKRLRPGDQPREPDERGF